MRGCPQSADLGLSRRQGLGPGSHLVTAAPLATSGVCRWRGVPPFLDPWTCRPYGRCDVRSRSVSRGAPQPCFERCQGLVRVRSAECPARVWSLLDSWPVFPPVPYVDVSRGRLKCRRDWRNGLETGGVAKQGGQTDW